MDLYTIREELARGNHIYNMNLRVTYYARVSTEKDAQLHSLDSQVRYYADMIEANEKWTLVNGYIDEGLSAKYTDKRINFLRMIHDAGRGKFDMIITKEITRFARNTLDSLQYTRKLLTSGVGVFFETDNINTLMPDSELRLAIMSSIAQDEVRKIHNRTKFGFKRSIEKGVVLGSSNIWGYQKNTGKLEIVEGEADVVRLIFDMYANQRLGMRTIAERLAEKGYYNRNGNPFSITTIRYILTNPKYKGYYCGNKVTKVDYMLKDIKMIDPEDWVIYKADESTVPAIVSEALWEKANALYQERSHKLTADNKTGYHNKYAYSGKVICGVHRQFYHRGEYKYKSGNKEYWACKIYKEHGKKGCGEPILYTNELDLVVRQAYDRRICTSDKILEKLMHIYLSADENTASEKNITLLRLKINEIQKRKDRLLDLNIAGKISDEEFQSRNESFNQEITEAKKTINRLEEEKQKSKNLLVSKEKLQSRIAETLQFSEGFDHNVVDCLLDRLLVHRGIDKKNVRLEVFFHHAEQGQSYILHRGATPTLMEEVPI